MKASEANAISIKNKDFLFNKGLNETIEWIKMSAEEGRTDSLFPHIPDAAKGMVEERIKELGYKVEDSKIFWGEGSDS